MKYSHTLPCYWLFLVTAAFPAMVGADSREHETVSLMGLPAVGGSDRYMTAHGDDSSANPYDAELPAEFIQVVVSPPLIEAVPVPEDTVAALAGRSGIAGVGFLANSAMTYLPVHADIFLSAPADEEPEVIEPAIPDLFADDLEEESSDGTAPSAAELFEDDFSEDDFVEEELVPDVPVEEGSIPPVIDRPLGVDEGLQIIVKSFVLDDARDLPEYGVALAEIYEMLNQYISAAGEGLAIGRLQELAEEITAYYRSRGLILAQAVLPVQDVQNGEIHFQIFEGILGRVLVEDNKMYRADIMQEPFADLVGRPVIASQVESALLQLTDFPGLTVFGLFQPGQFVGEADLVLKVQNEDRIKIPLRVDNQGTQSTGRIRGRATLEINNPTNGADRLSLSWQEGFNPDNQKFWSVGYHRYLGNGYNIDLTVDRNEFDVGGASADLDVSGTTRSMGARLSKQLWRSRQGNFIVGTSLTSKESLTMQAGRSLSLDELTVIGLHVDYDSVDTVRQALNFASLELSAGLNDFLGSMGSSASAQELVAATRAPSRRGGSNRLAAGQFKKAFLTYTRLQNLTRHQSLLFRTDLQWSGDLLVPLEQYSVGGPDNVRAYPVAQVLLDKAAFVSLEYLLDAPFIADAEAFSNRTWGELLQFSVFYDFAIGTLNDPAPGDEDGSDDYRGFGVGLRLNVPGTLSSRLMFAWPHGDRNPADGNKLHIWTDMTVTF